MGSRRVADSFCSAGNVACGKKRRKILVDQGRWRVIIQRRFFVLEPAALARLRRKRGMQPPSSKNYEAGAEEKKGVST
jgi:hypothetical protein